MVGAAVVNLLFPIGLVAVFAGVDFNALIFDFPPAGTGAVLVLPLLTALCTLICLALLVPVWRAPQCSIWQRVRYTWVTLLFTLLVLVMWYWNLLGWNY